jgi:hypothetical protein
MVIMRPSASGTTLDNASASGMYQDVLVMEAPQQAILVGILPARHAFDIGCSRSEIKELCFQINCGPEQTAVEVLAPNRANQSLNEGCESGT